MSSEVTQCMLAEICSDVSYGYTESATIEPVGPKFLRITDIQGGTVDWEKVPFCPASEPDTKKYKLEVGDIVVARTGNSTGENAQVFLSPPPAVFASYLIRFRPDPRRVNPFFVGYQLRSERFRQYVLSVRSGSAQPGANAKQLGAFPVQLIDSTLQDATVDTLRALDDRITLLRETNATLEAIAQALFKSWFVDFDPVHAKAQGRTPEGMDESTAALFPDSFEESELGAVPKGWRIGTLGEHTSYLNRGISPKYIEDGGIVVINQKCIRDFSLDLSKARRHDPAQRKIDSRELCKGDILVNSTGVGTLGRVAQVLSLDAPAIVDSHVTVMRAGASLTWNYLGLLVMRRQSEIEGMGEGSTGQTELSRGKLAILKLLVPSTLVLQEFDEVVLPLRERFAANQAQAQTLATLRDTLLPRLISGALRLPEAQQEMEDALP